MPRGGHTNTPAESLSVPATSEGLIRHRTRNNCLHPASHLLAAVCHGRLASSLCHFLTFRLWKRHPFGVAPAQMPPFSRARWNCTLCKSTVPSENRVLTATGRPWQGHLARSDCSEGVLNSTFHHQPLPPSLVAMASHQMRDKWETNEQPGPQNLTPCR